MPTDESQYHHIRLTAPTTREELRDWVARCCQLHMPQHAICPHHVTPLDYLCHAFFETGPRDAVIWANRGGGKTQLGAVATLLDLLFKPGIQIRILGGSFEQSEKMFTYLRRLIDRHFPDTLLHEPTQKRITLINGSSAICLAQSHRAVRGCRVQKLRADEVDVFDPDVWSAAQLVTRSTPTITAGIEALSTAHRPAGLMRQVIDAAIKKGTPVLSWCAWDVIEKCPPERQCSTCPLYDGCQGRAKNADGFMKIDDLIAMKNRVSDTVWKHEMLCEPARHEDAVFPTFDPEKHVRAFALQSGMGVPPMVAAATTDSPTTHATTDDPRAGRPCHDTSHAPCHILAGVDFGFTGPFVWLTLAITREEHPHVFVIDEFLATRRRLDQNLADISQRHTLGHSPRPNTVYCDVAGQHTNAQTGKTDLALLRDAGYKVKTSFMQILPGLELLDSLLSPASGPPRLTIHPRCTRLIAALLSYRWAPGHSAPIKDGVHDHPLDALRYAVMGHLRVGQKTQWRMY